jgi:hypothetical protein
VPHSPWVAVDAATIPAKRARELRDAWEDFIDGRHQEESDDAGTPEVRRPILDSWQRSRDAGVDPSGRQPAPSVVEHGPADELWDEHPLSSALPLIAHCMAEAAVEADHLLVVSGADGLLLHIRGDTRLRSRAADEMNFVEGALWSEAGAGTNAIGTAVAAEHAVQVFAAEHFTEPVQRWTCAAAPVIDPDTKELLGIIDLTGDFTGVNPHSLAVVVATASAVEEMLRGRMRERDDARRARYGRLLGPESEEAALVTGHGRVIMDPRRRWQQVTFPAIPPAGGTLVLPSGIVVSAEPVEDDDIYVVRRGRSRARSRRRLLELRVLGDASPEVRLAGRPLHLRPRHVELLTLIVLHRGRLSAESLCAELYGDSGHPASVRVEMSRLRRLLPGAIGAADYHLTCEIESDVKQVRALLGRAEVGAAAAAYPGPLLPGSSAPGIERARDELDGWLRQAVITSGDADALWAWARSSSGEHDLVAWLRLLTALDYSDARRGLAVAHIAALRQSESVAAM